MVVGLVIVAEIIVVPTINDNNNQSRNSNSNGSNSNSRRDTRGRYYNNK